MNEHLRERIPAFLYYFIIVTAACLYTLFDLVTFTLYFTYWLPAIILIILPILLYLLEPNYSRAIILGLLFIYLVGCCAIYSVGLLQKLLY